MSDYCECGIKLREGWCPRCQRRVRLLEVAQAVKDATGLTPREVRTSAGAAPFETQECQQCGSLMEAGCGKVCQNCRWVAPCGL